MGWSPFTTTPSHHPPTHRPHRGSRLRAALVLMLSLTLALAGVGAMTGTAAAAPVYEIEGTWVNQPASVSRGTPVVAEWRINVNDNMPAPSNDPVDNVTATFTVAKAFFDGIPDMCKTQGVTPASSLSDDGTTLTCNFGTVDMGTALVLQTPVVANGNTGEQIVLDGTSPGGETVELPPIPIRNPFAMDMQWTGVSQYQTWDDVTNPTYVDVDLEWSLRLGNGSDPGPDTITQRLTLVDSNGRPVQVGTHPELGLQKNWGAKGCTEFDMSGADGHPWSHAPGHPRSTRFVDSCTLTPVAGQPGVFDLTLSGIDYDLFNVPRLDSFGNPLPADWDVVASGMVWFRIATSQAGALRLQANAPTYVAPTGQRYTDPAGNNASNKTYVLPGGFSAAYVREATGNGGTRWDDTYRVAAGTTVMTYVANHMGSDNVPGTARYGVCQTLQTQFVDFNATRDMEFYTIDADSSWTVSNTPPGGVLEYYTGPLGDPDTFSCGSGTWTSTQPADPTTISAIRWTYPHSLHTQEDALGFQMRLPTTIQSNVPVGQDVWTFGSYLRNGTWVADANYGALTLTPNYQYPHTNIRRDVLVVVLATPFLRKAAAQKTVTPGVPSSFTLTYSANGVGAPATVDGYAIRDVLPRGMTYVAGSASPEPQLSTDPQGRQVLTWTLNDVPTNQANSLVYEAVADNTIAPGTPLTNTAVASLAGEESAPASATVTTTTNGYTVISKTADTPYIPNVDGSGDGEGTWTVTLRSFDPLPQTFTDTIDILPFEGDARGTSYTGDYSLVAVEAVAGAQVYYTTADPATLSDDPADPMNGAPSNPVGNSVGWTPIYTPDATAVRVIGPRLDPGAIQQFKVRIGTDGAEPRDLYVNRAQARTSHTDLVMRTSEPMTMAHHYAANLKKYVQDRQGRWRDANDLADFPAFQYGDTVRYRVVVTNIGQGTLTNIEVSDDKQPELGAFTIDELAPGDSSSHEYSIVLDESVTGTLVNTASATADTPPDAYEPPEIPSDPAGFEVTNYTVAKTSDPRADTRDFPGQKITYTVTVTQEGEAPAEAVFSDDLTRVLDDASYNKDVTASIGTATIRNGQLSWAGTVPVGGQATITYSVTLRSLKALKKRGDSRLRNVVTSPGCRVVDGKTVGCRTDHRVGRFDLAISKSVMGSSQVIIGDRVRYRLNVTNLGPHDSSTPIRVTDKLPKGLKPISARGKGWECTVVKAKRKVRCVRDNPLRNKAKAPKIVVTAKATKAAKGRRLVNTATVTAAGDRNPANNRDRAEIRVGGVPALPNTGYRTAASKPLRGPNSPW